jgi:signal transduction histidine kinase
MIPAAVKNFILKDRENRGYFCVAVNEQLNIIQYYGKARLFGITPPKYYLSISQFLPGIATESFESDFEIPFYNITENHVCNIYFLKKEKTSFLILIDKSEVFQITQKYQQFAHDDNISKQKFKRIAYELQQAKEKLKKSNQEKATLIAMLSHELGTPLTSIVGYSELLMNNPINPQKGLEIINRNAHYLKHMIENTLLFGQSEASDIQAKNEHISLQNFFNVLKATLLPSASKKGLSLKMFFKSGEKICIDITRTQQILINLINNAIKYTDNGSVELKYSLLNKHHVFSVIDTGLGIPENLQQNIFNPWERVEESHEKGAGIGLYISQKLAHALKGEIKLKYSKPGYGSIFQLVIPVQLPSSDNEAKSKHKKEQIKGQSLLIIDDDYDILELIEAMLSSSGLTLYTAVNYTTAKQILNQQKIDVILTDLNLGPVKASSFINQLKNKYKNTSVILMSAMPDQSKNNEYLKLGFDAVVSKPLDSKLLLSTIIHNLRTK